MSDTKRRDGLQFINWYRKEKKSYRKRHWRGYRHKVNATTRVIVQTGNEAPMPKYAKTSGWLTW